MEKMKGFKAFVVTAAALLCLLPLLSLADENPARLAVQGEAYGVMEAGTQEFSLGFPDLEGSGFPWGKRLVIEYVTLKVIVPAGQKVTANIQVPLKGTIFGHHLVMTSQGVFGGQEIFTASHLTRLYADKSVMLPEGKYTTHVDIQRSDVSGAAEVWATIQGYFMDLR
jgi:hypothetical protein